MTNSKWKENKFIFKSKIKDAEFASLYNLQNDVTLHKMT